MKSLLSILVVFSFLFSQLYVNFSKHYCGGKLKDTTISISNSFATCGMETTDKENQNDCDEEIASNCCETVISTINLSTTSVTQENTVVKEYSIQLVAVIWTFVNHFFTSVQEEITLNKYHSPPKVLSVAQFLSSLQVYRL